MSDNIFDFFLEGIEIKLDAAILEECFKAWCKEESEMYRVCPLCKKRLPLNYFWEGKNGIRNKICADCMKRDRDPFNPLAWADEFIFYDIPFIAEEWNRVIEICKKKKKPFNYVFPKYLSIMKLKAWKGYGWKDSILFIERKEENGVFKNGNGKSNPL